MALASLEALEAVAGPVDHDRATILLEMASGEVEDFCHRRFARVEDDEITIQPTWGGDPGRRLRLPSGPVESITSVSRGETVLGATSYRRVGDYLVWSCGQLWDSNTYRLDPLTVVYTHGFDPIPATVVSVVCGMVGRALGSEIGVSTESLGSYSVGMRPEMGQGVSLSTNDESRLLRAGFIVSPQSLQMVRG